MKHKLSSVDIWWKTGNGMFGKKKDNFRDITWNLIPINANK